MKGNRETKIVEQMSLTKREREREKDAIHNQLSTFFFKFFYTRLAIHKLIKIYSINIDKESIKLFVYSFLFELFDQLLQRKL